MPIKLENAHISNKYLSFGNEISKDKGKGIKVRSGRLYKVLNKLSPNLIAVKVDQQTVYLKKSDCEKYFHFNTPLSKQAAGKLGLAAVPNVFAGKKGKVSKEPKLSVSTIRTKLKQANQAALQ